MIIDKQEANTNMNIGGEITQLQPTRDIEIRYKHGVSNDKVSIH